MRRMITGAVASLLLATAGFGLSSVAQARPMWFPHGGWGGRGWHGGWGGGGWRGGGWHGGGWNNGGAFVGGLAVGGLVGAALSSPGYGYGYGYPVYGYGYGGGPGYVYGPRCSPGAVNLLYNGYTNAGYDACYGRLHYRPYAYEAYGVYRPRFYGGGYYVGE